MSKTSCRSKEPFFTAQNISAGYGNRDILHNISFSLEPGALTALLGPNGCGKTTLIKTICGLLPHTGDCFLKGSHLEALSSRSRSRLISYIPQRSGITLSMSVLDVVLAGFNPSMGLLERPSSAQRQEARDTLSRLGIGKLAEQDFLSLSEGQKQLCILARTLVGHTSLLLLDEPDSALDFTNRQEILRVLSSLIRGQEKAGLLCLHDPNLALDFCDQLLLMKDGRCISKICPAQEQIPEMEAKLETIYGPLSLHSCPDRSGRQHLVMIPERSI